MGNNKTDNKYSVHTDITLPRRNGSRSGDAASYTMAEIARRAHLDRSTIYRLVSGERTWPAAQTVASIAKLLRTDRLGALDWINRQRRRWERQARLRQQHPARRVGRRPEAQGFSAARRGATYR